MRHAWTDDVVVTGRASTVWLFYGTGYNNGSLTVISNKVVLTGAGINERSENATIHS